MRSKLLSPSAVRRIGVILNEGKVPGWTERIGELLDIPPTTAQAWATPPTSSKARSISGPACVALMMCLVLHERGALPAMMKAVRDKFADVSRL